MPKIRDIEDKSKKGLDLSHLPWLKKAINSNLIMFEAFKKFICLVLEDEPFLVKK